MMESAGIADAFVHSIASWLTTWIYTFYMPVLVSLSGAVYTLQKGRHGSLAEIATAKLFRLLILLLVAFAFWIFPIKWISDYYTVSLPVAFMQILFPNNRYLAI